MRELLLLRIHSTSRPSPCLTIFNSQNQPHNLQGPVTNENVESLVKSSEQFQNGDQKAPTKRGALPCDCTGHASMKSTLLTALSLVGFHCLNCFLSACPALGARAQHWMSLLTRTHGFWVPEGPGQALPRAVGSHGPPAPCHGLQGKALSLGLGSLR